MVPGECFGPRLRQERERQKISLSSIAADTKISITLLEGLERDDVKRWPTGIFRRSFVRSYAQAIGMDAETVLREFQERFPEREELPAVKAAAGAASILEPRDQPLEASCPSPPSPLSSTTPSPSSQLDIVLRVRVPRSWEAWLRWALPRRSGILEVSDNYERR
jgi:transcriptional regulator with XRE-family HTH domain